MAYEKLDIFRFGNHLLTSGDIDPVYTALHNLELTEKELNKWLLAYWCFYHCGFACYVAKLDAPEYWGVMKTAAENLLPSPTGGRWPRGKERRHFRGAQATKCIQKLRDVFFQHPEDFAHRIAYYVPRGKATCHIIMNRTQEHYLFGPWISFKIADMVERVMKVPVSFEQAEVFMFKDPVEAALMLWRKQCNLPESARPKKEHHGHVISEVVSFVQDAFQEYKAPPANDRPVGLQEIETILCKWKSHMNGHYPLNNDIHEINEGLKEWERVSSFAANFRAAMPLAKKQLLSS